MFNKIISVALNWKHARFFHASFILAFYLCKIYTYAKIISFFSNAALKTVSGVISLTVRFEEAFYG